MACSKSRLTGSCGVSCETQLGSPRLHRLDAECDVIVQRRPKFLRAIDDVLAADAAREGLVLGFLCVFTTTRLLDPSTLHRRSHGFPKNSTLRIPKNDFVNRLGNLFKLASS